MQLKGFLSGLAVASLLWIGVPAAADWAAPSRSASAQEMAQQTAQQNGSYSTTMGQEGQSMCPFQREAQRSMARCPYSGQSQQGGYGHGKNRGSAQGVRQSREPLET
jgi:hypothetical protein